MSQRKRSMLIVMALLIGAASTWAVIDARRSLTAGAARQRWDSAGIQSYHLRGVMGFVMGGAFEFDLIVGNGRVLEASCFYIYITDVSDEPCDAFDPADYTVAGLFRLIDSFSAEIDTTVKATINYDRTYGFPRYIYYDRRQMYDEEYSITIEVFEVSD